MPLPDHTGETCIVIGNGPSLRDVPRSFLDKYPTFGMNYLNRLPYQPTYYISIDSAVLNFNAAEITPIAQAAKLAFISSYPSPNPALDILRALPNHVPVGKDSFVFGGEWYMSGNTAAYVALKLAYFMGFARVLLVGVDHSEGWKHFTDNYPAAKGPHFTGMRYHFALAQDVYSVNGREIVNLSAPSALDEIFKRGNIADY